jgi:hypothetical protein
MNLNLLRFLPMLSSAPEFQGRPTGRETECDN